MKDNLMVMFICIYLLLQLISLILYCLLFCIQPYHIIGDHKSNYVNEDHFIYMKVGNPDPKTNQPRFDVIYILDDNCELEQTPPVVSPYDAKNRASFSCTDPSKTS